MPKPVMVYANASQNRMLKKIGKEIGLTERKVTTKYYGNQREDSIVSKWQLVGTHTARRTFITLALERGMRPEVVMKITGHKKLSTMQLYISITNNVMQEEMAQAFG
jgi:site-specific recombinase XerD